MEKVFFQAMQKIKSSDSTIDYDKKCTTCGNFGVIHAKSQCHSCYFGLQNNNTG